MVRMPACPIGLRWSIASVREIAGQALEKLRLREDGVALAVTPGVGHMAWLPHPYARPGGLPVRPRRAYEIASELMRGAARAPQRLTSQYVRSRLALALAVPGDVCQQPDEHGGLA
jgi:hypothetical protein